MFINVRKWGNSYAIRIPRYLVERLDLQENSALELTLENDRVVISKPKYTLESLLSEVTEENLHQETETGSITGKEIW